MPDELRIRDAFLVRVDDIRAHAKTLGDPAKRFTRRAFFDWLRNVDNSTGSEHEWNDFMHKVPVDRQFVEDLSRFLTGFLGCADSEVKDIAERPSFSIGKTAYTLGWNFFHAALNRALLPSAVLASELCKCQGDEDIRLAARMTFECLGRIAFDKERKDTGGVSPEQALARGEQEFRMPLPSFVEFLNTLHGCQPDSVRFALHQDRSGKLVRIAATIIVCVDDMARCVIRNGEMSSLDLQPNHLVDHGYNFVLVAAAETPPTSEVSLYDIQMQVVRSSLYQYAVLGGPFGSEATRSPRLTTVAVSHERAKGLVKHGFRILQTCDPRTRHSIADLDDPRTPAEGRLHNILGSLLMLYQKEIFGKFGYLRRPDI